MLHADTEREISARMTVRIRESFIVLSFVGCISGSELNHVARIEEEVHAHFFSSGRPAISMSSPAGDTVKTLGVMNSTPEYRPFAGPLFCTERPAARFRGDLERPTSQKKGISFGRTSAWIALAKPHLLAKARQNSRVLHIA
jgi:hypothetical protein